MGIVYHELSPRRLALDLDGISVKAGILRPVGKWWHGLGDVLADAAAGAGRNPGTPLVAVMDQTPFEGTALVLRWEPGIGWTQDHDWSGAPVAGWARPREDGKWELCAADPLARSVSDLQPLRREEMARSGLLDNKRVVPWRAPRILDAWAKEVVLYERGLRSSSGPVREMGWKVTGRMEDGSAWWVTNRHPLSEEAMSALPEALMGKRRDEAEDWVRANLSPARPGPVAASLPGFRRIALFVGGGFPAEVQLMSRGCYLMSSDDPPFALVGGSGMAGDMRLDQALLEMGERIERAGGEVRAGEGGEAIGFTMGRGFLTIEAQAGDWLVRASDGDNQETARFPLSDTTALADLALHVRDVQAGRRESIVFRPPGGGVPSPR